MADYVRSKQSGVVTSVTSTGSGFGSSVQSISNGNPGAASSVQSGNSYFTDQKKGEVNELKQLLRSVAVERDVKKRRDVIKKVIAYMTLGVDVSRLFTEMVMAIETRDLVIKKMVYLYLCTYAHTNPELAIMCVNTLQRDCSNEDPMVRGLALRSLCSLRLPSIVEYISEPLQRSLIDSNAYVRKTGVMGVLKLHYLAAEVVVESNFVDKLYAMLLDVDTQVVTNCLLVLDEMHASKGGMSMNRVIIIQLLSRLDSFNEWGLCKVLGLLARYDPVDDDETFSIMNLLDPVLRTSNSGVVLAVVKCFLRLTKNLPDCQHQVYERARGPLLTLMAGASSESIHCILSHILALAQRRSGIFDIEYRLFYVRYNDPAEVSRTKVAILALLANPSSVAEIITELAEYISGTDMELSRRAVRAIGEICHRVPEGESIGMSCLLDLLDVDADYIRGEAALAVRDLLRRNPDRRKQVLPSLRRCLRRMNDEPEGKAAVIWMIGEYGYEIPEGPYLLESIIDNYSEEVSGEVKLQLLTGTMKLFFKRAPEVQHMLGRLLAAAVDDVSSQDLHDRALLYYRLLITDVNATRDIISSNPTLKSIKEPFFEDLDTSRRDAIFEEFDTLSILYSEPSDSFTLPEYRIGKFNPPPWISPEERLAQELADLGMSPPPDLNPPISTISSTVIENSSVDLLGMSESENPEVMFGFLNPGPSMSASQFQNLWGELGEGITAQKTVLRVPSGTPEIEKNLAAKHIHTMASGDKAENMRFFFYAYGSGLEVHLMQCTLLKRTRILDVHVKTTAADIKNTLKTVGGLIFEVFGAV